MEWLTAFTQDLQQSWPALWHGLSITLKVVVSTSTCKPHSSVIFLTNPNDMLPPERGFRNTASVLAFENGGSEMLYPTEISK